MATIKSRACSRHIELDEDDFTTSIIHNFPEIAREWRIGNAAGYTLQSVTVAPRQGTVVVGPSWNQTIKYLATLTIVWLGQPLAHRPASPQPTATTIPLHLSKPLLDPITVPLASP